MKSCELFNVVTALFVTCFVAWHGVSGAPWLPPDLAQLGLPTPGGDSAALPGGGFSVPEKGGQTSPPTVSDTETARSGNSGVGMTFNFSGNHGDAVSLEKETTFVLNPWANILPKKEPEENGLSDEDSIVNALFTTKGICGDLCAQGICSEEEKCVVLEDCTLMCNKSDDAPVVLQSEYPLAPEERQCDQTGKVCEHGTCPGGQRCECELGYEGETCAHKQCYLFCLHGGTCYKTANGHSSCACAPEWQGVLCKDKRCTLPCARGSCLYKPPQDVDMFCNCPFGWTGDFCEKKIPDPAASSKILALAVGIAVPSVCFLACAIAWYILWRNRAVFVFKVINMFKAYEDDDDKLYDAYVSLTEGDYLFVKTVLQPKLEGLGHKLYMHVRDGLAGDVKSEEILEAVEKSRRCIMLLTSDYINNEWCRFEYLIAQHETCIKLKQRIIPILMDDIDKDKKKMDKTLRFIIDSVKCLRYPREPLEPEGNPTSTTCIQPGGKCNKQLAKYEKELEKFWEKLRLTMPKKRDAYKEKSPLSIGSAKSSQPHYSGKPGFKSLFGKLSKNMTVSHQPEKSSSAEFSFIERTSSSDKIGEVNSVSLISVTARVDRKLDSFYSDTLERSLTGERSDSGLVIPGEDIKRAAPGDIHLKV
ncbi:hypothetical protein EGW08_007201 [Elysia chlorotica]|uniref:TIR domain-containing protein n=1 Tax=Elysia chlorotica TaxID=188477 RepID=A0A433TTY2_ELYCH|nr:hypothetical protein EGW08_007201 [Elysia chlorotica]